MIIVRNPQNSIGNYLGPYIGPLYSIAIWAPILAVAGATPPPSAPTAAIAPATLSAAAPIASASAPA